MYLISIAKKKHHEYLSFLELNYSYSCDCHTFKRSENYLVSFPRSNIKKSMREKGMRKRRRRGKGEKKKEEKRRKRS